MALVAMSNRDTFTHVSDRDPAKTYKEVPMFPDEPGSSKVALKNRPMKMEPVIDMEKATVFELAGLDVFLAGSIYDKTMAFGQQGSVDSPQFNVQMMVNQTNFEAVRYGLKGWTNFQDKHGKPVEYKKVTVTKGDRTYFVVAPECMDLLDTELVQELAGKIKEASRVSVALEKNSAPV